MLWAVRLTVEIAASVGSCNLNASGPEGVSWPTGNRKPPRVQLVQAWPSNQTNGEMRDTRMVRPPRADRTLVVRSFAECRCARRISLDLCTARVGVNMSCRRIGQLRGYMFQFSDLVRQFRDDYRIQRTCAANSRIPICFKASSCNSMNRSFPPPTDVSVTKAENSGPVRRS